MAPKVFVSHASEDKERFVLGFAEKLRQNGVDAWLDKWEMLPGDSLVEKIFEEGLKEAQAVIVVLSSYSISKPWVKEELNTSIVNKISNGTKIIPVVIDQCDIPESLKSTVWERVQDTNNYQDNLDRIIASVFGHSTKPSLGSPPSYTQHALADIPGLTQIDNLVLKKSCDYDLENNAHIINPGKLFIENDKLIVPENELKDSLEMLDRNGFVKLSRTIGEGFSHYQITTHGMESYLNAYLTEYQSLIRDVISLIVNKDMKLNAKIIEETNCSQRLIDHILDLLDINGHLDLSKTVGGGVHIYNVSPALRRMLA
ncbi:TIR domain-containing protein [Vreelandella subterranea]|uniref:TIR domain-containing protein n=1 Tax=Vreelandella subterranea TaxID=416874 RepID=A0A1H9VV90_9GAMM|nr:toll/interleukin-1 receptor domain-containing protein [Halomonas subterranea]SES25585.1 TIR domain-containing protein [Halomonas subterranea]